MEIDPIVTTNLKQRSVNRILIDMIQETRQIAGSGACTIMIVDDDTANIISSFLTMTELLNEGIFSVEKLHMQRQRFPRYNGLYFISPTSEALARMAEDFSDSTKPMYSKIFIYFSYRVMDNALNQIITNNVVRRIKGCKELNLSFLVRDRNLFDLDLEDALKIYSMKKDSSEQNLMLETVMERLFTVAAVLKEFPHIQYQKSSPFCKRLAEKLNSLFSEFYQIKAYNDKRGILLITDRTIDITSPLLHDYNYEPMVYDLFDIKNGNLDLGGKSYKVDENDELWLKYKNNHMCSVFEQIQGDFQAFMDTDMSRAQKAGNFESFDDMANILHGMKGFKTKTNQFSLHLKLAEQITDKYKQNCLLDLIELEQDIVTGINSRGETVSNKDIFTKFTNLRNKITEEDKIRLITALHSCLDVSEKEFNILADKLNEDKRRSAINLEYLGVSFNKSKSKQSRREPTLDKKEVQKFQMKSKTLDYNFLRSSPKMEGIVEACSRLELSKSDFAFIDQEPKKIRVKSKAYGMGANMFGSNSGEIDDEMPYLIVFMLGGIAHNEIAAIEKLQAEKGLDHRVVIGSTSILTASDYVTHLRDLSIPSKPNVQVSLGDPRSIHLDSVELKIMK